MNITLLPTRVAAPIALSAEWNGPVLTLNGIALDFGPMPNGSILPRQSIDCPWINGPVERDADGNLTVPLIVPFAGGRLPEQDWFPAPIVVTRDGPVTLPDHAVTPPQEPAA